MTTPVFGALAVVIDEVSSKDTRILCVTRRNRPLDFALPCGKVDPGESPRATMERELVEETGVTAWEAQSLYVEEVVPREPIEVFLVGQWSGPASQQEQGITPLWLPFSYLEGEQCTYREFARRLRVRLVDQGIRL